jgi:hypothetical protein
MRKSSFVVQWWAAIFGWLAMISVSHWIPKRWRTGFLIDIYVLGHLFLAILASILLYFLPLKWLAYALTAYGSLRIFEVIVYQINVLLFDEVRATANGKRYSVISLRRLLILLLHNFAEIVFWFSVFYITFNRHIRFQNYPDMLFSSLSATLNLFDIPLGSDNILETLIHIQGLIGLFLTLISLARYINTLPSPRSIDSLYLRARPGFSRSRTSLTARRGRTSARRSRSSAPR